MEIKKSKISTKGQLTIPKDFREKLKLHEGDEVILYIQDDGLIIKPKKAQLLLFQMKKGIKTLLQK